MMERRKKCDNECRIYPCAFVNPEGNCRMNELPADVREKIECFYIPGKMKQQVVNLVVEAYVESLTKEPDEKLIARKLDIAERLSAILKNLYGMKEILSYNIERLIDEFEKEE